MLISFMSETSFDHRVWFATNTGKLCARCLQTTSRVHLFLDRIYRFTSSSCLRCRHLFLRAGNREPFKKKLLEPNDLHDVIFMKEIERCELF